MVRANQMRVMRSSGFFRLRLESQETGESVSFCICRTKVCQTLNLRSVRYKSVYNDLMESLDRFWVHSVEECHFAIPFRRDERFFAPFVPTKIAKCVCGATESVSQFFRFFFGICVRRRTVLADLFELLGNSRALRAIKRKGNCWKKIGRYMTRKPKIPLSRSLERFDEFLL